MHDVHTHGLCNHFFCPGSHHGNDYLAQSVSHLLLKVFACSVCHKINVLRRGKKDTLPHLSFSTLTNEPLTKATDFVPPSEED